MAEVIHHAEQEFWQPPITAAVGGELQNVSRAPALGAACQRCATEFLVGARFCHACGTPRDLPSTTRKSGYLSAIDYVINTAAGLRSQAGEISWPKFAVPSWVQYLHFHQIQRWIALPTASFVAFLIGVGCLAGAIVVSLVYRAQNFVDFQAIQMWRIEWLLGAIASFVAGILLKRPSPDDKDHG